MENQYPNYQALAAYLNTFDNPQRLLRAFVAVSRSCIAAGKPVCDSCKDGLKEP